MKGMEESLPALSTCRASHLLPGYFLKGGFVFFMSASWEGFKVQRQTFKVQEEDQIGGGAFDQASDYALGASLSAMPSQAELRRTSRPGNGERLKENLSCLKKPRALPFAGLLKSQPDLLP
jgi:hypothetical protein